VQQFTTTFVRIRDEMGKMMVGQQEIVDGVLVALFAGGHVLLEGVPAGQNDARANARRAVNVKFSRIQFTPDLMPADIVGTNIIMEDEQGRKESSFSAERSREYRARR